MHGMRSMIYPLLDRLSEGLSTLKSAEIVLCPPAVYLAEVAEFLQKCGNEQVILGAQNAYCETSGAFTGEISPEMLVDVGCRYVLIGHSERRQRLGEDDTLIAKKVAASYHAGLTPIICVGESTDEREAGITLEVVERQLEAVRLALPEALSQIVVAYEPVWAIGTGLSATPLQAETVHLFIRDWFKKVLVKVEESVRILYGGSVHLENAKGFFLQPNVDGALVGGASLKADEFIGICQALDK